MSENTKAINTWDQVESMRATRKIYIKKIVLSTNMREIKLDREVEIYPDDGQSPKTQYLCVLYTIVRTL
jgi:hypothetical protein